MSRRNLSAIRRTLAIAIVLAMQLAGWPAFAAESASVFGEVVAVGSPPSPVADAIVHFLDPSADIISASSPTAGDGTFRADGIAPATYRVGVEKEGRLFITDIPLTLAPGQSQRVTLAVPGNSEEQPIPEGEEIEDNGGLTWWNNPLTASLIVVGGAVILGILIDQATDDDPPPSVSPFTIQE